MQASGHARNIHIIGNALDQPDSFPQGAAPPVSGDYILFVGQISQKKNIHSLIAAFRQFASRHPQVKLVIVGNWGKQAERNQIEALNDDRIVMLGALPRSKLGPLYRGARFFVNPSIREGHSNTLLEAISIGCPVLLSDRSLASALGRAHANPEAYRVAPDRFPQWEKIAQQTIAVYQKLAASDPATSGSRSAATRI